MLFASTLPASLRDPLTYQACPGSGIGPWFACYESGKTGEIWARPAHDGYALFWDSACRHWAGGYDEPLTDGQLIERGGFGWVVRLAGETARKAVS